MATQPHRPTTPPQTKTPPSKADSKPEAPKASRKKREALPEIPLDQVTAGRISPEEASKFRPVKAGSRNATQLKIDKDVKQAHTDWINAGREHKNWAKMSPWTIQVPKAHEDAIKAYIRKAGLLHDVQIRFGRSVDLPEGKVAVVFVAKDRAPKTEDEEAVSVPEVK